MRRARPRGGWVRGQAVAAPLQPTRRHVGKVKAHYPNAGSGHASRNDLHEGAVHRRAGTVCEHEHFRGIGWSVDEEVHRLVGPEFSEALIADAEVVRNLVVHRVMHERSEMVVVARELSQRPFENHNAVGKHHAVARSPRG